MCAAVSMNGSRPCRRYFFFPSLSVPDLVYFVHCFLSPPFSTTTCDANLHHWLQWTELTNRSQHYDLVAERWSAKTLSNSMARTFATWVHVVSELKRVRVAIIRFHRRWGRMRLLRIFDHWHAKVQAGFTYFSTPSWIPETALPLQSFVCP